MTTQVSIDMVVIMELVVDNPGIFSTDIIKRLGFMEVGHPESGNQRLARARKKLGTDVFVQKDNGKNRWFDAKYARENSIPSKIEYKKKKRYDS